MFAETVAVCCKNGTEHINAFFRFVPHRKRHIANAKLSLLTCRETHVYCENRTERMNQLCLFLPHRKHHIPVTKIIRLVFGE